MVWLAQIKKRFSHTALPGSGGTICSIMPSLRTTMRQRLRSAPTTTRHRGEIAKRAATDAVSTIPCKTGGSREREPLFLSRNAVNVPATFQRLSGTPRWLSSDCPAFAWSGGQVRPGTMRCPCSGSKLTRRQRVVACGVGLPRIRAGMLPRAPVKRGVMPHLLASRRGARPTSAAAGSIGPRPVRGGVAHAAGMPSPGWGRGASAPLSHWRRRLATA